eukprot:403338581
MRLDKDSQDQSLFPQNVNHEQQQFQVLINELDLNPNILSNPFMTEQSIIEKQLDEMKKTPNFQAFRQSNQEQSKFNKKAQNSEIMESNTLQSDNVKLDLSSTFMNLTNQNLESQGQNRFLSKLPRKRKYRPMISVKDINKHVSAFVLKTETAQFNTIKDQQMLIVDQYNNSIEKNGAQLLQMIKKIQLNSSEQVRFIPQSTCKKINILIEEICYSLQQIGFLVLQEYQKELSNLGISQKQANLCSSRIPQNDGEQLALLENIDCLERLLRGFTRQAIDYYIQLNDYFERKPMIDAYIQQLLDYILTARFKIIELLSLLHTDTIFKYKDVIEQEMKVHKQEIKKEQNYFKRRQTIVKLKSLDPSVEIGMERKLSKRQLVNQSQASEQSQNSSQLNLNVKDQTGQIFSDYFAASPQTKILSQIKSQKVLEKMKERVKQEKQIHDLNQKLLGSPEKRQESQYLKQLLKSYDIDQKNDKRQSVSKNPDHHQDLSMTRDNSKTNQTGIDRKVIDFIQDMKMSGTQEIQKALNYSTTFNQLPSNSSNIQQQSQNHSQNLPRNLSKTYSVPKLTGNQQPIHAIENNSKKFKNLVSQKKQRNPFGICLPDLSSLRENKDHSLNSNRLAQNYNNQRNASNSDTRILSKVQQNKQELKIQENTKLKNFLKFYEKHYISQEQERLKKDVYSDDEERAEYIIYNLAHKKI